MGSRRLMFNCRLYAAGCPTYRLIATLLTKKRLRWNFSAAPGTMIHEDLLSSPGVFRQPHLPAYQYLNLSNVWAHAYLCIVLFLSYMLSCINSSHPRINASTSSRFCSINSLLSASTFSRNRGSVLDGRTLNHQLPKSSVIPSV